MTSPRSNGYIGPGLVLRGELTGEANMQIDGQLEGHVRIGGHCRVGPGAHVEATLRAGAVEVEGHLQGDVAAAGAVSVARGGAIEGDVQAGKVAIEDGGVLQGSVRMEFELPAGLSHEGESS